MDLHEIAYKNGTKPPIVKDLTLMANKRSTYMKLRFLKLIR